MHTIDKEKFLDRYWEEREISRNKKGSVQLVRDKATGEKRILKIVYGMHSDIYQRIRELSHPGLPTIYEVLDFGDEYYILQEYVKGVTLYEKQLDVQIFSAVDVKKYALCLCDILAYLHQQTPPIIHRDIKPSNIMITDDDCLTLIDFDASRTIKDTGDKDTKLIVTKGYAPPEQYGFSQTDPRSDIYAVGILMAELLTGTIPDINQSNGTYGKFGKIIKKCTSIDPARRYKNVLELKSELLQLDKVVKKKYIYIGSVIVSLVLIGLPVSNVIKILTRNSVNNIPNLENLFNEDGYPYGLLSVPYIETELKELLGIDYDYFMECLQNVTTSYDEENNAFIIEGGISGLYTIMEAILEVRENGNIYAAFLYDDAIVYYTNDATAVSTIHEGALYSWVERLLRNIVFKNAPEPIWVSGNYINDWDNVVTMNFFDNSIAEFQALATFGVNTGEASGEIYIDDNYACYEEDGNKLHFYFSGDNILIFEEGSFGGLNVSFQGNYIKK